MDTQVKSTVIIFNKFNYDAVIAAAILSREIGNAVAVDVSQMVPTDADTYVWLGLTPANKPGHFSNVTMNKEHIVVTNKSPIAIKKKRFSWFRRQEVMEVTQEEECISDYTLIQAAFERFELTNTDYRKLAFHVAHFHMRNTEVDYLAFVYDNLLHAEECLRNGTPFSVRNEINVKRYIEAVGEAKRNLSSNYRYKDIREGDSTRTVLYTTMDGFGFHLTLRLIKLVHKSFMNTAMGMNGQVFYTNMKNLAIEDKGDPFLVLN